MGSEKHQSTQSSSGGVAAVIVVILLLLVLPGLVLLGVGGMVFVGLRSRAVATMQTPAMPVTTKAATPMLGLVLVVKQDGTMLLEGAEVTLDELPAKVNEFQIRAPGGVHVGVAADAAVPPDEVQQVFNKLGETGASYFIQPPTPDEAEGMATDDEPVTAGEQPAEPADDKAESSPEAKDALPDEATTGESP